MRRLRAECEPCLACLQLPQALLLLLPVLPLRAQPAIALHFESGKLGALWQRHPQPAVALQRCQNANRVRQGRLPGARAPRRGCCRGPVWLPLLKVQCCSWHNSCLSLPSSSAPPGGDPESASGREGDTSPYLCGLRSVRHSWPTCRAAGQSLPSAATCRPSLSCPPSAILHPAAPRSLCAARLRLPVGFSTALPNHTSAYLVLRQSTISVALDLAVGKLGSTAQEWGRSE